MVCIVPVRVGLRSCAQVSRAHITVVINTYSLLIQVGAGATVEKELDYNYNSELPHVTQEID
jgi:hypothetical protein